MESLEDRLKRLLEQQANKIYQMQEVIDSLNREIETLKPHAANWNKIMKEWHENIKHIVFDIIKKDETNETIKD